MIEELNNGVKQASDEIKEATKPSNLVKSIRDQDTRPFEVIEDKEAFFKNLNQNLKDSATPLPKGMSVEEFKQSLESVENKDRFLEHLETRDNSDERLAALNLVEPILREPHIEIFIKDKDNGIAKKEYIKAFKDENKTRLYMLITQDNDMILRTFITDTPERYVRNHVRNADIIHSFIQPNRTAKSDNALSDVVVYGENTTQKPLTDQEDLLKSSENLNETTQNANHLSPLEQANAKKLAKLESEKEIKAEALKKLHFDEIKKLIDESPNNGKDIIVIGEDNLTPEIVEYIHKKHAKVGIERLDEDEITAFNFTYPKNAKAIIDYQGIQHALNKHGINSPSVKFSKQPPITYKDIANYRDIVKNADETIKRDNRIISYKQVNGHFVVVEQINRNKSEFIFKTMFKEKGDYKNAPDYKKNIKEND
ncbi:DUF3519 domain-containing protein [Helicobacter pylori]|uniref:PBECR3 domain-containing polyvalent protein n=1 Tax=Helicobacter pylori TaxID=210 RepID=UPI003F64AF68